MEISTKGSINELSDRIDRAQVNISSRISILSTSVNSFKVQNQKEISTLSGLIEQIEEQSSIKLDELKSELKDVQIKSADFSAIVDDILGSVVSVRTNLGQGSGSIIRSDGYIITNVHVINGASSIKVTTNEGGNYNVVAVAGIDEDADIAVLKIDADNLESLPFADSGKVRIGEKVIAAGNPAGLSFTVTEGIVSALRTFNGIDYIQTDVPINPGNSGGPLINLKGEVLGINNFKIKDTEGLGFAISSNDAKDAALSIISEYESQNQ
ncbi:MAG TPA: trypsin-like peptidase domain-containing protein [Candidatus Nanoarchaeia archaeon]|nr:trypsin-like peptidase domain-containing protein [Candidatus Nanoarchaeia archaeon]